MTSVCSIQTLIDSNVKNGEDFDTVVFTIFLPRSLLRKTVARQRFA